MNVQHIGSMKLTHGHPIYIFAARNVPPGETSYGVILGVLEFNVRAKIRAERVIFQQSFSVCYAVLTSYKNGETAVDSYNPALFWVLSVSR